MTTPGMPLRDVDRGSSVDMEVIAAAGGIAKDVGEVMTVNVGSVIEVSTAKEGVSTPCRISNLFPG